MKTQQGFGLVQVLVTVAIMGIVLTAVATMMVTQMQETKAMTEKLAALDVQKNFSTLLSKETTCTYNLQRAGALGPYSFSAGDGTPARPFPLISLGATLVADKPGTGQPEVIVYQVTADPASSNRATLFPASVISQLLYVKEINVRIRCDSPPCNYAGATDVPAFYEMVFHDKGLVRSLMPVRSAINLKVGLSAGVQVIQGCVGSTSAVSTDLPGSPCTFGGESTPRGIVTYNWSGGSKYCCMADSTTQNISHGAYNNGGFATLILACKGM